MPTIPPPDDANVNAYLSRVVAELLRLYKGAQEEIIGKLDANTLAEAKESRLKGILREITRIVDALDAAAIEFSDRVTTNTFRYGARSALEALEAQGIKTAAFEITAHQPAVRVIAETMATDMLEANNSIKVTARKVIRPAQIRGVQDRVLSEQVGRGVISGEARRATSKRLANEIRERLGDGRLVQAGSKTYTPEKYAELVVRTRTREAVTQGAISGATQYGIDLFRVSVHDNPCPICQSFQGKIYSLSGDTPDFPVLDRRPPFHPHCKHTLTPVVESILRRRNQYDLLSEFSKSDRSVEDGTTYDQLIAQAKR